MNKIMNRLGKVNILKFGKYFKSSKVDETFCTEAISTTTLFSDKLSLRHRDKQESRNFKDFSEIQGPSGKYSLPFIGLIFHFKPFGNYTSATFNKFLLEMKSKYGKIAKQRVGRSWMVFLFDPDDIQQVCRSDSRNEYRPEIPLITCYAKEKGIETGLAFKNGEEWYNLRKIIQEKLLKPSSVVKYTPMIEEIADEFVDVVGQNPVLDNTLMSMSRFATESAGMLCFSRRFNCLEANNKEKDIIPIIHGFFDDVGKSFDSVPWYKLKKTTFYRKFENEYDEIRRITKQKLDESIKEMTETDGDQHVMKSTFLQSLLSDPNLTTDVIFSSLVDLFIAAIDTAANTLTFLLTHLAENPDKQQKLYEEIQRQFATSSDTGEAKFRNMPYLKACLRESHRLVFPLRDGARWYLEKDMVIGGYLIPKGNQIVFCNNTICQDEKYFRNPDQFIPERWLRSGGERSSIHPFSCLPFGHGTRSCIGQRFSELETYVLITKLLLQYKLYKADTEPVSSTYNLFATPANPVKIGFEKR